jgi:hypothetical protein
MTTMTMSRAIRPFALLIAFVLVVSCDDDRVLRRINHPPQITSINHIEADIETPIVYRASYFDRDCTVDTLHFLALPSWLSAEADSVFGVVPVSAVDTSFLVVASDGVLKDTLQVMINLSRPVAIYGDSRTGHAVHRQIVAAIVSQRPRVVFHTGDLVGDGFNSADWDSFNVITADLREQTEFFPTLGNHEGQSPLFFDNFDLPNNEQWYSVDRDSIHFIVLNSCVSTQPNSEQWSWLVADLQHVSSSIKFKVALFHHPPYSTGPHTEDEAGLRETVVPLFEQYGVDIVFSGHDHSYERSYCGGRYYIVTGGGGAPMHDQTRQHPCSQIYLKKNHFCRLSRMGDELRVRVYDPNLNLLDHVEISRAAR